MTSERFSARLHETVQNKIRVLENVQRPESKAHEGNAGASILKFRKSPRVLKRTLCVLGGFISAATVRSSLETTTSLATSALAWESAN